MALLDGTYEVTSQQAPEGIQTLFEATASDGTPVHIVWYDLPPHHEARFEHYRRILKRMKRSGLAALHDVVSRPGAHYVAWELPRGRRVPPNKALTEALAEAGYPSEIADIHEDGDRLRIYGLAFGSELTPSEPVSLDWSNLPPEKTVPPWLVSWSLSAALILVAALTLLVGFNLRTNDSVVVVPDLRGRSLDQAVELLDERDLGLEATPVASPAPANTILKSDPPAGTQLRPGRLIRASFALPADRIAPTEVPQLVGLEFPDQVESRLREAGLSLGSVARIPADTDAGIVISQRIPAGERLGQNQAIDVLVSLGPLRESTFLPNLVGLDLEDARFLAHTAGLSPDSVIVERVPAARELVGRVLNQSLPPHLPVPIETAVLRLMVADTPTATSAEAETPNLIGLAESGAREAARNYHLSFEVIEVPDLPEGVIDQTPAPGSVSDGSLRLQMNIHPVDIPVPRVLAQVLTPELRVLHYTFFIEPGIPEQQAEVLALPLEGEPILVIRSQVKGGDLIQGDWQSPVAGPITFRLLLNGEFYNEQRINSP